MVKITVSKKDNAIQPRQPARLAAHKRVKLKNTRDQ
jgi:hypothetical protein